MALGGALGFGRPWRRGTLRGRRGTWWHLRSFHVAGVAQCHIHLRFAWQAWHLWHRVARLGWFCPWRRDTLRGRRGTWSHLRSFHVAGVAQCHIHLRFAWQAWHLWHWVARLGWFWSPVTPRHFVWQAWHLVTSTFVSRGTHGTMSHPPSFCVAGVAPSLTHPLSHTTLSHTIFHAPSFTPNFVTHHLSRTIFHTQLCHPPSFTHHLTRTIFHTPLCHPPSLTHHLSHTTLSHTIFHHTIFHTAFDTPSFTHHFVTHRLSHTQLCHTLSFTQNFHPHHLSPHYPSHTTCHTPSFTTPSFTHNFVTHHLSPHHLSHTLCHTVFHTQLCHTLAFTHNFHTRHLSHTALSHTHTPSFFVTHHLSHSTLSHTHTPVLTFRSFTTSFAFPSFSVPATTFGAHYWKKLTCGVFRSFNFWTGKTCVHWRWLLGFGGLTASAG